MSDDNFNNNSDNNTPERVRLVLMGISSSAVQRGAYAMLLAQEDGPYKIPIVIGTSEAQSIAIKLEGLLPPRPMTHDLFCSFAHAFGIRLTEVDIYKYEDGIFSAEMKFTDGDREVAIDSRTSDAVAIAIRCGAPIYIARHILEAVGTIFEESSEDADSDSAKEGEAAEPDTDQMTIEELQQLLEKHIEEENYEEAARITQIINKRNNNR